MSLLSSRVWLHIRLFSRREAQRVSCLLAKSFCSSNPAYTSARSNKDAVARREFVSQPESSKDCCDSLERTETNAIDTGVLRRGRDFLSFIQSKPNELKKNPF